MTARKYSQFPVKSPPLVADVVVGLDSAAVPANQKNIGIPLTNFALLGVANTGNLTLTGNLIVTGTGKFTGALDMTSQLINNVLNPVSAQDAATKNYVDTTPSIAKSIQKDVTITNQAEISYDTVKETLEIKGVNNTLQVGQESYVFVKNISGGTLNDGDIVRITGYDSVLDALEVVKAKADVVETAEVSGAATTTILNNDVGLITTFGRINDLNTSAFTEGEEIFLSETVAGGFTATRPSAIPIQVGHIGKVNATTGFIQIEIRELPASIRAIFSDSVDQTFTANVSKAINFNTEDVKEGITHSTSVDNEEITFPSGGVYLITVEPQYTRTVGGGTDVLNMYMQKSTDGGTNFVNIANSNIKVAISAANLEEVTSLTQTLKFNANDILRIMIQVEDSDLKLDAFVGFGSGDNLVPATPSVICNIHRIGA